MTMESIKFEVIEKASKAKMSHAGSGKINTSTTLFDSHEEAVAWMRKVGLSDETHEVVSA